MSIKVDIQKAQIKVEILGKSDAVVLPAVLSNIFEIIAAGGEPLERK
jgi:hypothetical protein